MNSKKHIIFFGWILPDIVKRKDGSDLNLFDDDLLPMVEGWPCEQYTIAQSNDDGLILFGYQILSIDEDDEKRFELFPLEKIMSIDKIAIVKKYLELFAELPPLPPELLIHTVYN